MGRSVVTRGTERCEVCQFAHRWCTCAGLRTLECPVQVDLLVHRREDFRPTSTSRLISRVLPASRRHVFSSDLPLERERVIQPGRTLWILHPGGELPPAGATAESLQLLLLDGNWREASRMRRSVESWGRLIRLPPGTPSRFELRSQHNSDRYSTVETLIRLLELLGLSGPANTLRTQFELHVYAGLRSRGALGEAARFLEESPLERDLPGVLRALQERRRGRPAELQGPPLDESGDGGL
ncbi:MAG: DTW domain-containing protein [Verrucomicrobia bacterium]|nr:DTW domain-containing protein [Verrucomicrobiota bacterium]